MQTEYLPIGLNDIVRALLLYTCNDKFLAPNFEGAIFEDWLPLSLEPRPGQVPGL